MSQEEIEATRELLESKLEATGELGKIKASVMAAGIAALSDDSNGDGATLFYTSSALKSAKKSADGAKAFKVVIDHLNQLGLSYTVQVLLLEASLNKSDAHVDRKLLASELGVAGVDESPHQQQSSILSQLLVQRGGAAAAGSHDGSHAGATAQHAATNVSPLASAGGLKPVASAATTTSSASSGAAKSAAVPPASQPTTAVAAAAPVAAPKKWVYVPKAEETDFVVTNLEDKTFVRYNKIDGQQFNMDGLKRCKIFIFDAVDSIQMDYCEDCELVVAACEGSIFIRNCKNITATVACKQLRTREMTKSKIFLFAGTDPVIESSSDLDFYPFNLKAPSLVEKFRRSKLDASANRFVHIYDFTPIGDGKAKKNYTMHWPDHGGLKMVELGADLGTPEAPAEFERLLRGELQPAASSESGANKSLDIKKGAGAWTKPQEEEESPTGNKKPAAAPSAPAPAPGNAIPSAPTTTTLPTAAPTSATGPKIPPLAVSSLPSSAQAAAPPATAAPAAGAGLPSRTTIPLPKSTGKHNKKDDSDDDKYDSFSDESSDRSDGKHKAAESDDDTF